MWSDREWVEVPSHTMWWKRPGVRLHTVRTGHEARAPLCSRRTESAGFGSFAHLQATAERVRAGREALA